MPIYSPFGARLEITARHCEAETVDAVPFGCRVTVRLLDYPQSSSRLYSLFDLKADGGIKELAQAAFAAPYAKEKRS